MSDKNHMSFCGIIFDMDGVIFDSEVVWKNAFLLANKEFGLQFTEEYRQSCCGKDEQSIRRELKEIHHFADADNYRDFIVRTVSDTIEKDGAPLKDGFLELIDYLKRNKYKIALATSSKSERALKLFGKKKLNPSDIFDGMIFSEDVKVSKPNPEIFLLAADKIGIAPSRCIVLEDSLNGIQAAKLGGFASIMVKDLIEPDEDAKNFCLTVANNLGEVISYLKEG